MAMSDDTAVLLQNMVDPAAEASGNDPSQPAPLREKKAKVYSKTRKTIHYFRNVVNGLMFLMVYSALLLQAKYLLQ